MAADPRLALVANLPPEAHALLADRQLAVAWRRKARPKQLPPWDVRRPLSEWGGFEGYPPGCTGPVTCDFGAPEDEADRDPDEDYCDHEWGPRIYRTCYKQGGRGAGKTWTGSSALCEIVLWLGGTDADGNQREYGIVGPTHDTAWSVCVESQSGIRRILGDRIVSANRSSGEIVLRSGAIIYVTGADTGAPRLQGKNLTAVWADEIGLWRTTRWYMAWIEGIVFATRKRPHLVIATGTPKQGHPLVKYLVDDPTISRAVMSTKENKRNLGRAYLARLKALFSGTRLGRQEMDGEFLTDIPGALWTLSLLDGQRVGPIRPKETDADGKVIDPGYALPPLRRINVAHDPANTAKSTSDEHGILVQGIDHAGEVYILADYSGNMTVDTAVRVACSAAERHQADAIVIETNGAEDWLRLAYRNVVPEMAHLVKSVRAKRGKELRAEPVAMLAEQQRFHMVRKMTTVTSSTHASVEDHLGTLIDQMTSWVPSETDGSPDRIDAMVHGVTDLLETQSTGGWGSSVA